MKTRICILAASALAVLPAPVAGAMIPWDTASGYGSAERHPLVIKPAQKKKAAGRSSTSIAVGRYNPHAYVPGGSSPRVGKAITSQGKRALR